MNTHEDCFFLKTEWLCVLLHHYGNFIETFLKQHREEPNIRQRKRKRQFKRKILGSFLTWHRILEWPLGAITANWQRFSTNLYVNWCKIAVWLEGDSWGISGHMKTDHDKKMKYHEVTGHYNVILCIINLAWISNEGNLHGFYLYQNLHQWFCLNF